MGREIKREFRQLLILAFQNIICQNTRLSFIAPSLAATAFGAIILKSSLTGLRMTHGKQRLSPLVRARANKLPSIFRGWIGAATLSVWLLFVPD